MLTIWQIIKTLAELGVEAEIEAVEALELNKTGEDRTLMPDYTKQNKDTHVRIRAPIDQWESYLNKGWGKALVNEVPLFKPTKNADVNNPESFNLILPLLFLDGENKGKKTNFLITLTPKSLGRVKKIFDSVGFKYAHDGSEFLDFDPKDMKGIELKAFVGEDNWQGKVTNKVLMIYGKDYIQPE